jgi:hypothetical protein
VVAADAAQRAADHILDRQPAGAAGDRAIERQHERAQEADAQRQDGGRAATALLEPIADLDESSLPTAVGRVPEEMR